MANNYYTCASCVSFKEGICTNEKNDLSEWKVASESVCHEYDELPENFKAKLAAFKAAHPYAAFSAARESYSKGKEYIYMGGEFLHARTPIKEQMRIRRPQNRERQARKGLKHIGNQGIRSKDNDHSGDRRDNGGAVCGIPAVLRQTWQA